MQQRLVARAAEIGKHWPELPVQRKRVVLAALIERVEVSVDRVGRDAQGGIGERIRDKIAASKKKGMWMGGVPPLGYGVRNHKLVMIDSEADTVRLIFRRYAELGSVRLLQAEPRGDRG